MKTGRVLTIEMIEQARDFMLKERNRPYIRMISYEEYCSTIGKYKYKPLFEQELENTELYLKKVEQDEK